MNISFGSDNHSGVHPSIMQALMDANHGYEGSYGEDPVTEQAQQLFKSLFGPQATSFFVFNGTGANVLCLKALTHTYHAVICAQTAHINVDECGAPERFTGCKLLTVPTKDGKLRPEDVTLHLRNFGVQHHSQPGVISIAQVTELGTLYTPEEVRALADLAHNHGMYLHMDGSRLANAAAALGCSFKEITTDAGVDALSLGGTKNGMLLGEAVIILRPCLAEGFMYIRKQAMQLFSKSRFVAAQYLAYFTQGIWKENARHANNMAQYLAASLAPLPQVVITQKVESNAVFAILPEKVRVKMMEKYCFYIWDEDTGEVRWMCAFNTLKEHIDTFVNDLKTILYE